MHIINVPEYMTLCRSINCLGQSRTKRTKIIGNPNLKQYVYSSTNVRVSIFHLCRLQQQKQLVVSGFLRAQVCSKCMSVKKGLDIRCWQRCASSSNCICHAPNASNSYVTLLKLWDSCYSHYHVSPVALCSSSSDYTAPHNLSLTLLRMVKLELHLEIYKDRNQNTKSNTV